MGGAWCFTAISRPEANCLKNKLMPGASGNLEKIYERPESPQAEAVMKASVKFKMISALISATFLGGCGAGHGNVRGGSHSQELVGRVSSTYEVLLFDPGGCSRDYHTAYAIDSVEKSHSPTVVFGYDKICPAIGDTSSTYKLGLRLQPVESLNQKERRVLTNQWFIFSCERL
ncbi:MAG: hypothetical protein ACREP7_19160 [Lysobacter sp.]